MRAFITILPIAFCTSCLALEEAELPRSEYELIETLEQNNLQEAIRILLKSYIKRDHLDSLELNRAAMQGLLDRSGFGVTLIDREAEDAEAANPYKHMGESLSKEIAYLRPGTLSEEELKQMGKRIEEFVKSGSSTLILDMRVPAKESSFQEGAKLLNYFCPPNELLFKIQKPGETQPTLFLSKPTDVSWDGELVILIDSQTPPAAEAIVNVLKRFRDPVIFGKGTPGQTVEYEKVIISDAVYLRFAVAEVIFSDDSSIFREGIQPDLVVDFQIADKAYVFDASKEQGMQPFLYSKPQPRHNEAALVHGRNPELDYAVAKSAGKDTGYDNIPIHDRVVQAALDYLITKQILTATED